MANTYMSIQKRDKLNYQILNWLQKNYAAKKLDFFIDQRNQWLVSSYIYRADELFLCFARGKKEARIKENLFIYAIDISNVNTLHQFKEKFKNLCIEK